MIEYDKINNKKIIQNAIALYIRMIVIMAINFYTARVVLDVLGVTDYGIYNVVATTVIVFSFLKSSLSEATQRFLNYEMGSKDSNKLKEIFSVCMNCYILLAVLSVIIGETFWICFADDILNIPIDRYEAAAFIFHIALLTFAVSIIQVPYNATIIAYEKMFFFAYISILEAFLKLGLTIGITYIVYDKLKLYSLFMLINALVVLVVYIYYCNRKFNVCNYIIVKSKDLYYRILSYTGWNMCGNVSGVLSESGVSLVFNAFSGVIINASIGLSNQINNSISGFTTGYMTAFKPQLIKSYAAKQYNDFQQLFCRSSKYSFFLFFIISIPIIVNIDYLLSIWLVEVPAYASSFSRIILIGTLIDATSNVFYTAIGATGKIKYYQISISIVFLLHFLLTALLLYLGIEYIWVFFLRLLTRGILNFVIGLYFINKQTAIRVTTYFYDTLLPIVKTIAVSLVIIIVYSTCYNKSMSLGYFICNTIIFEIVTLFAIYKWGLNNSEKEAIIKNIMNKIK